MPQIKIEHDIGDKVYVVTAEGNPRTVVETVVIGCFFEKVTDATPLISYKVFGVAEEVSDSDIFKDPWSAFNPDAPRAED